MADISFDSAKNIVIKYGFCGECRFTTGDKHCIKRDCYRAVKQLMEAVPVVHGRWIETVQENGCAEWTEFRCSVCGAVFDGNEWLFDKWKGCPVCLARMDGDDHET